MYGLIGKMLTAPGQRDAVIAILLEGTVAMPGCRSYVVARDPTAPEAIWITEVALAMGYANPGKFAAAFRRVTGQPPSRWAGNARGELAGHV